MLIEASVTESPALRVAWSAAQRISQVLGMKSSPRDVRAFARCCIPLHLGASPSAGLRLNRGGKTPAPRRSRRSRHLRDYESASTWITLWFMEQDLWQPLVPRPTTAAATRATLRLVRFQVVAREQMAIAAEIGYGHGFEDTFQRKAHHMCFGCFKPRPATMPPKTAGLRR